MRSTAAVATVSERLGKVVWGAPHAIGSGFTANHFSEEMFDGRIDPLLMVDHFVMTTPTFAPHLHAGVSAVTAIFEDSVGGFLNRNTLGHNIALQPGDLYWLTAASGVAHEEKRGLGRTRGKSSSIFRPIVKQNWRARCMWRRRTSQSSWDKDTVCGSC